jgi:hypothetical protein
MDKKPELESITEILIRTLDSIEAKSKEVVSAKEGLCIYCNVEVTKILEDNKLVCIKCLTTNFKNCNRCETFYKEIEWVYVGETSRRICFRCVADLEKTRCKKCIGKMYWRNAFISDICEPCGGRGYNEFIDSLMDSTE